MMKLVNKILLVILENAPTKHILEVLFVLLESQIKCTKSSKLINLLPKCIGRVSKGGCFRNAAK